MKPNESAIREDVASGGAGADRLPPEAPLARALDRLETLGISEEQIARVDVDLVGVPHALTLEVEDDDGARWFRARENELVKLTPEHDRALPLATTLGTERILAYRPGRRVVVERALAAAVEKGYRPGQLAAAARRHEIVSAHAGRFGAFVLPRVLARRPRTASLLFERIDGEPFDPLSESEATFESLGRRLRAFQEMAVESSISLPFHRASEELAVLETWSERVGFAAVAPDADWRRGFELAVRIAVELPAVHRVLAHRDFHDRQLRITPGRVALLDFDLLARADAALDPGNFVAHLELRRLQGEGELRRREASEQAFVAGLDRGSETGFGTRLAFYRGTSLLRLALVYSLRPRWRHLVADLVEAATRTLDSI